MLSGKFFKIFKSSVPFKSMRVLNLHTRGEGFFQLLECDDPQHSRFQETQFTIIIDERGIEVTRFGDLSRVSRKYFDFKNL
jgi:hypothetical protein